MTNSIKGFLSQTIQNSRDQKDDLMAIIGLPDKASKIRNDAVDLIEKNSSSMEHMQKDLQESLAIILNSLQSALVSLEEHKDKKTHSFIDNAHDMALLSKEKLETQLQHNLLLKTRMLNLSQDLRKIVKELQNQMDKLSVEEQKAKDKANKFKKERLYFLALGPFGLAGLATATALFVEWNSKASAAKRKAAKARNEMNSLKLFQDNINVLQESFGIGIEVLSNAKNALDFMTGDIKNIIDNIYTTNEDKIVVMLYLNTAIKEVNILLIEVA